MSNEGYQLITITIYMAAMLIIGWYSFNKTRNLIEKEFNESVRLLTEDN
jgi:sodium/proline symporter